MASEEEIDHICVRFTGKNYLVWEFQFRMYVKGKGLWSHLDDVSLAPLETTDLDAWEIEDAQIITWILGTIDPHMINNLRSFSTAQEMWNYLKRIYNLDNAAKRFQLELDIANYKQGNLSVQEYYSGFLNLWTEHSAIIHVDVPKSSLADVQEVYNTSRRDQFLMKLRAEFEVVRGALLNRNPVPSLDTCVGELLREEQRLATQGSMSRDVVISESAMFAYAPHSRGKGRDIRHVQCFSCKQFGHFAQSCSKKFCNYCKKRGHIISDCPTRPPRSTQRSVQAFSASTSSAVGPSITNPSNGGALQPEIIQQMVLSALSTLGIQGKSSNVSRPWFLDSGASNHMTASSEYLHNLHSYHGNQKIQIADGNALSITNVGDLNSDFRDVFVAPGLTSNLLSVGQLVDNNCNVNFSRDGCLVQEQVSGKVVAKGPKVGRLFPLQFISSHLSLVCKNVLNSYEDWHRKLGHPNSAVLSHLFKNGLLGNKSVVSNASLSCSVCKLAKSKTLPFPSGAYRASSCFELIHSDVWGMSPVVSHARYKYFVTFIDDYSRFTWIYFLRSKSEVFSMFKKFLTYVETQFHESVKIFRSDSGGEYMSREFQEFLQQKGILSQRSCPNTPQQNGMAERKNRHLLDVTRTLLLQASVPPRFWVEALSTAVFLINRLPSTVIDLDSPFFRLFKIQPNYNDLHTFGCVCFVHLPPFERHKLGAQSVQCAFMGYSHSHKGFVCYDVTNHRFRISRNVTFFDNQFMFPCVSPVMNDIVTLPKFSIMHQSIERYKPGHVYVRKHKQQVPTPLPDAEPPPDPVMVEPRRSGRISRAPDRYSPDRYDSSHTSLTATLSSISIPTCYSQAVKDVRWIKAMNEELQALQENFTWDIVSCPPDVKPIGCKWVYSVKLNSDGSLNRFKARLVALGNKQEYGIDYDETFAPVAKMTSVRTVLSIAASNGWTLHQLDVKNAFLHGDLAEDIYMTPPQGLFPSSKGVCKLKRSLYGLKQAPRAWYEKFRSTLLGFSFTQSQYDSSLFIHRTSTGIVLLLLYVDDMIITGSDHASIQSLKQQLQAAFHMKDLGNLHYFLGLEVHSTSKGIFLHQHKYATDLISMAGLQSANPVDTPLEVNVKYHRDDGDLLHDPLLYRQLVGSLNYLTITRPDISFAVQQVSQFMHSPRHLHLAAVRRIIRYLKGSSHRGLFFPTGVPLKLSAYSDADWAGCPDTRRSVTGWCMFLGSSLISWKSKKQARVSKSSTESEYRAMSAACSEIIWLRGLLAELGFPQIEPTSLYADNTSAIQIVANPVFHERTKHIEVDCHSIRDAYDDRIISLPHVSTQLQIADILTKAVPRPRHQFLVSKLMLIDKQHQFEGGCE